MIPKIPRSTNLSAFQSCPTPCPESAYCARDGILGAYGTGDASAPTDHRLERKRHQRGAQGDCRASQAEAIQDLLTQF